MFGHGPLAAYGTRTPQKPVRGYDAGGPQIRELEDTRHDLADLGLQCRPGNQVQRDGVQVPVDPEWWFPVPSDTATIALAVGLCRRCPARARCLEVGKETARHYGPAGIWGGVYFGSGGNRRSA